MLNGMRGITRVGHVRAGLSDSQFTMTKDWTHHCGLIGLSAIELKTCDWPGRWQMAGSGRDYVGFFDSNDCLADVQQDGFEIFWSELWTKVWASTGQLFSCH